MPFNREITVIIPDDWREQASTPTHFYLRVSHQTTTLAVLQHIALQYPYLYELIFSGFAVLREGVEVSLSSSVDRKDPIQLSFGSLEHVIPAEFNILTLSYN